MSIHPRFAEAILAGSKLVEFRKRALAPDVDTVLIYATAPVQVVVGEFTIARTELASPMALWRRHRGVAGIERSAYFRYYGGSTRAAGLVVGQARRYRSGVPLSLLSTEAVAPQSFRYLNELEVAAIRRAGRVEAAVTEAPALDVLAL